MMKDVLIQELEQEAMTTRRVLERVPESHLEWKPNEKSMTLGQLALHVASVSGQVAQVAAQLEFQAPEFNHPAAKTAAELLPALDESIATAKRIVSTFDDAAMAETWRLVSGDRELMAVPRVAILRTLMLNHWYHHRGQLTVYLRQCGVPVPSIYGPSADENPFAMKAAPRTAATPV